MTWNYNKQPTIRKKECCAWCNCQLTPNGNVIEFQVHGGKSIVVHNYCWSTFISVRGENLPEAIKQMKIV
jgi:hypothetical protein